MDALALDGLIKFDDHCDERLPLWSDYLREGGERELCIISCEGNTWTGPFIFPSSAFYTPPPILESLCPSVVLSMCPIVSAQYLLNYSTILYQTWYGGVLSWDNVSGGKIVKSQLGLISSKYDYFTFFFLHCWFVCNQTWFDSIAS